MNDELKAKELKANGIVDALIMDLKDRRGLRQAWDSIDEDTQKEIRDNWQQTVFILLANN